MKQIKHLAAAMGVGIGLAIAGASANAAVWSFQDDDVDFLYRPTAGGGLTLINPSTCAGAACNIAIGDVLVTPFRFPTFTIDGVNQIPAGSEVTGVAVIQYYGNAIDPFNGQLSRQFGAYSGGLNSILQGIGGLAGQTVPEGAAGQTAMIAAYMNTGNLQVDIAGPNGGPTNCTGIGAQNCIQQAAAGTLLQVDGGINSTGTVKLDPDNFWFGGAITAGSNINTVWNGSRFIQVVQGDAGLTTIFNPVMPIQPRNIFTGNPAGCTHNAADGCVDYSLLFNANGGGASDPGGGLVNGAFAHSSTIASTKVTAVPEPASLALLASGLIALGAFRRRKS